MAKLRITRLGHGGVLYRSPGDRWVWVDRWSGAPTYVAPPEPWQVDVIAPTHMHFDHVGDDAVDVVELAGRGVEAVGMNKGGRFDAAGIGFTMVHAEHTGGVTITGGDAAVTRDLGCWGWLLEFEDGTRVYHTGDTDLFGDMALVRERWAPTITVLPIGGHYTMGPREAALAVELLGVGEVLPIHYGTIPVLRGTPGELVEELRARGLGNVIVHAPEPGESISR